MAYTLTNYSRMSLFRCLSDNTYQYILNDGTDFCSAPPADSVRCQKCLNFGHWTYECSNTRKYLHRDSRTKV